VFPLHAVVADSADVKIGDWEDEDGGVQKRELHSVMHMVRPVPQTAYLASTPLTSSEHPDRPIPVGEYRCRASLAGGSGEGL
jgi:hypothetical protein